MTDFVQNPDTGEILRRDPLSSQWVPASMEDYEAAQDSGIEAALKGAGRTVGDVLDMVAAGGSIIAGAQLGRPEALPLEQEAFARMGQRDIARQAAMRESPVATLLGENFDIAAGGAGLAAGAARRTITNRVRNQVSGYAGQLRELPGGAAGRRFEQMLKTTGLSEVTSEPLVRSHNRKILNTAVATRIGGDEIMESLVEAGFKITDDVMEEMTGNAISKIRRAVPEAAEIDLSPYQATLARVRRLVEPEEFLEAEDVAKISRDQWTGRDFKQVRETLNKMMAAAGKTGDSNKRRFIEKTIERLDKIVVNASDQIDQQLYREGRSAYRMAIALTRNAAAVSDDGWINPKSFRNAIRTTYGTAAKQGRFDSFDPATADVMRTVSRARELGVQAPDSGTAQRLFPAGLAGAYILGQ